MDLADLNETREYGTPQEGDPCLKCDDGEMVERYRKDFSGDGIEDSKFLGCSNYPRCKHTENI